MKYTKTTYPLERRPVQQLAPAAVAEFRIEGPLPRYLELYRAAEARALVAGVKRRVGVRVRGTVHVVGIDLLIIGGRHFVGAVARFQHREGSLGVICAL